MSRIQRVNLSKRVRALSRSSVYSDVISLVSILHGSLENAAACGVELFWEHWDLNNKHLGRGCLGVSVPVYDPLTGKRTGQVFSDVPHLLRYHDSICKEVVCIQWLPPNVG